MCSRKLLRQAFRCLTRPRPPHQPRLTRSWLTPAAVSEMAGLHQLGGIVVIGLNMTCADVARASLTRAMALGLTEAAERVSDPGLRLGAGLIARSHLPFCWLSLPWTPRLWWPRWLRRARWSGAGWLWNKVWPRFARRYRCHWRCDFRPVERIVVAPLSCSPCRQALRRPYREQQLACTWTQTDPSRRRNWPSWSQETCPNGWPRSKPAWSAGSLMRRQSKRRRI